MSTKKVVTLAHGSGGSASATLIKDYFHNRFGNTYLNELTDQAILTINSSKVAFTTDSYVIDPIFFPGGDIGSLAVFGTVNDLAVGGATPKFLSVGYILEEGFPLEDLEKINISVSKAATLSGVEIVTGDTKVVQKGSMDKIFINTSGIGEIAPHIDIRPTRVKAGQKIIVSGTMGDHGIAILTRRKGLSFNTNIVSDSAPLNDLVRVMLGCTENITMMRDPTRGGLASSLNEIAEISKTGIVIDEALIPLNPQVRSVCEILGMDPLHIANEGKLVAFVEEKDAEALLKVMKSHELGKNSAIIGEVKADNPGMVIMKTLFFGTRIVEMLHGDQLPRIC